MYTFFYRNLRSLCDVLFGTKLEHLITDVRAISHEGVRRHIRKKWYRTHNGA